MLVPNVVLLFVFAILRIDNGVNDELHANGVHCLLKILLLEEELVIILKGNDVLWSRVLFDVWAGPVRLQDCFAYQTAVFGDGARFLAEDKGEVPVVPAPFCSGGTAGDFYQLVDKEADGSEVRLPDNTIKRGSGEFFLHHLGDDNHGYCGQYVVCLVLLERQKRSETLSASHRKTIDLNN